MVRRGGRAEPAVWTVRQRHDPDEADRRVMDDARGEVESGLMGGCYGSDRVEIVDPGASWKAVWRKKEGPNAVMRRSLTPSQSPQEAVHYLRRLTTRSRSPENHEEGR